MPELSGLVPHIHHRIIIDLSEEHCHPSLFEARKKELWESRFESDQIAGLKGSWKDEVTCLVFKIGTSG